MTESEHELFKFPGNVNLKKKKKAGFKVAFSVVSFTFSSKKKKTNLNHLYYYIFLWEEHPLTL